MDECTEELHRDFPGGPVVKTLSFHCKGHGFHPRPGNQDPACFCCCLVAQSCPTLRSHGVQHARLSFTISRSLLKLLSVESVMPTNHLVLCCPLLLLPSIFPTIRVFGEVPFHRRWSHQKRQKRKKAFKPLSAQDRMDLGNETFHSGRFQERWQLSSSAAVVFKISYLPPKRNLTNYVSSCIFKGHM